MSVTGWYWCTVALSVLLLHFVCYMDLMRVYRKVNRNHVELYFVMMFFSFFPLVNLGVIMGFLFHIFDRTIVTGAWGESWRSDPIGWIVKKANRIFFKE